MESIRTLTCIVCPRGCTLEITLEDGKVISVKGNICPRGIAYAEDECIAPKRTVTSTVRCKNGALIPVKTSVPVPKELIFKVMKEINAVSPDGNLKIGEIIIKSVAGTDSDIVVSGENNI